MSQTNKYGNIARTHEGARAYTGLTPLQQLRRSIMACMLWESQFYESGQQIASRIQENIRRCNPRDVENLAVEARTKMNLRHAPLLLARELARYENNHVGYLLPQIIQRPDELTEFLSIYWQDGKTPISAQIKKGLAAAFTKFDAYQLAKYNRDNPIKLRDVLFLCHARPKDEAQAAVWKALVDGALESPDTWEVALSGGADKRETWERLLQENKLGALALLRNLRNMQRAGVSNSMIASALLEMKTERVLPFRFIAASRYVEDGGELFAALERVMFRSLVGHKKLPGKTVLLVDVSGSMEAGISDKSDMTRMDAACALAIMAKEICESSDIYTFSNYTIHVSGDACGFALARKIKDSQTHGGTRLGEAVEFANRSHYDRMIVFTDEQSHTNVGEPIERGYMVNVASYKNGVGYGKWAHIDGFSEAILEYILEMEEAGF